MEIKSLSNTSFETIFEAFNRAFEDYETQWNSQELKAMCDRRGFDLALSFAAFEGEKIVSFTLNGIGDYDGKRMAYDTGTGTVKEYRGRGLASRIFEYSIPFLKRANIGHYLLEVLQHNAKAASVYRKIGFEFTRDLNYFVWQNEEMSHDFIDTGCRIGRFDLHRHRELEDFWDFKPSWQNSFESICRVEGAFVYIGAFLADSLVGYCIFEPASGDIAQIAVSKAHRRKGIGSLLLAEAGKLNLNTKTKLINADVACSSISGFLKAKNIAVTGRQFEMMKEL